MATPALLPAARPAEVVQIEIWRGATLLVRLFGAKAPQVAQALAGSALAEGDEARAADLLDIKRLTTRLIAPEPR